MQSFPGNINPIFVSLSGTEWSWCTPSTTETDLYFSFMTRIFQLYSLLALLLYTFSCPVGKLYFTLQAILLLSTFKIIWQISRTLGVSSEKINRWFKDICQIGTDPPSPHLILDIFILDKYKLVFTPPPLT